ncbi:Hpt domain-containing protein [Pedobacter rhodius]|uniref:Hpt domain-containing protein n=1 Tax=Pedobacter rhodius TaxID=3004098 RepID=A0ABT4KWB3_9SPHI|nr:Hpt domain-containing protein [Pedobacter sp. SJ11]MCZ4223223.1 Hpt domain-containing protein [Pedobacter sp. SJ11]
MDDNKTHKPLDFSYLIEMVGHDPETMIEVFETFLEETPIYMAELENALSNKDWRRVTDYAHRIKPTLTYIGRSDVKDFIQSIEGNVKKAADLNSTFEQVEKLRLVLDVVYIQIQGAIAEVKIKYNIQLN